MDRNLRPSGDRFAAKQVYTLPRSYDVHTAIQRGR